MSTTNNEAQPESGEVQAPLAWLSPDSQHLLRNNILANSSVLNLTNKASQYSSDLYRRRT